MPYRTRFNPLVPALMLLLGILALPLVVFGLFQERTHNVGGILGSAFWLLVIIPFLLLSGFARLRRMARSGWTGLRVDEEGVSLAARPGRDPLFFPWSEIGSVVYFGAPRMFRAGTLPHVGVRLNDAALDTHERRVAAALERADVDGVDRTRLEREAERIADPAFRRSHTVSCHLRARHWWCDRTKLQRAVEEAPAEASFENLGILREDHEWIECRDLLDRLEDEPAGT